jgi:signal transduction histidine kinase/DNA-binding response OmpR family regulator
VEDDAIATMDIENNLKQLGYGVCAKVAYGEDAIERVKENTPDIVLMDIVLKGVIDGIEAAEAIRSQFDIPVIFLTAFADKDRFERANLTYPFGFILKPFQDRELKITIEMALYTAKVDAERKQAEERLLQESTMRDVLLDNLPCVALILKKETREIVASNKAAKQIGAVPGKTCYETGAQRKDSCSFCLAPKLWATGDPQHLEVKYRGTYYEGIWVPLTDELYVHYIFDITDRKKAEEDLLKSGRMNEILLDSLPHPALLINSSRTVIAANRIALETGTQIGGYCWQTFGHSLSIPEEHRRYIAEHDGVIPPGWTKCTFCLADESLKEQKSANTEVTVEGSFFDSWWVPINEDIFLHYAINITEPKHAEEERKELQIQLQQSQKMEAIGTLAGGIAHDFNNILFPMVGFTEMALEDLPGDSPIRNNLNEILRGTKRAADLVKQILTFSRQVDRQLKPLKVQLVIKEVLKLIRSSLPSTIKIKQNVSNKCGFVMADATQIHQVAMNLMTNAYHAMQETGGELEVTLKEIELGVEDLKDQDMAPGPYVCLTIADTGIGMDKAVLDRIFDPYFTTKEKYKGTGLGLSVVLGIVKSYGGDIRVYSEPGKQTAFHVYLPVIKTHAETQEIDTITQIQKGTERILLVDDEDSIVKMEQQMLDRLGYHVTARTSSIEALEAFRSAPDNFDLVITDMTMPNMTGIQLSQKLLEIRSDISIIICTGFSEQIDEEKVKAMGIRGYTMKPVVKSELGKKIRDVLDN